MNRSGICRDRHLARRGWSPTPREVGRRSATARRRSKRVEGVVDPVEQLARRQGPVALDERRCGPGRSRPGRTGRARAAAVEDRSISPSQYGTISATWASTSRGPQRRLGASRRSARRAARARRPRPPGAVAASRARAARESFEQLSSMALSVARRGVAWVATTSVRRARRARPTPPAGETRDDRDHLAGRRQPGRRPDRRGRLRQGRRLPAAQGHRPRRVLGRQRPPGRGLLPRAVGLHARSRSAASRPRSATGPATSWSRTTSGSSSRRR